MSRETVTRFATRVAPVALGVALSVYLAVDSIVQRWQADFVAESFRPSFWQPWHALRAGVNPYPDALHPLANGAPYLYPPWSAEVTLPLSWLPYGVAACVFIAGLAIAAILVMWALDVRAPWLVALWVSSAV